MATVVNGKPVSYVVQKTVTTIAPASSVSFTPYGYLSGTNVQAALQQVNDTFTLSGSVVGGASFWTSLGTVAYSAATAFTLSGGYSGIVTMTPLKYSISGVTCYGAISMSGTAYSGASTTTMVSIIGVPLVAGASGLTAMSYGDFSRIRQVTIPLTGYWDTVTDSTYLNDRAGLPGGYPWNLPTAHIIGYNFRTGTIDAGTGNYANLVVNGAQFSSLNSNKGLSITTTSNLWTATDLNLISSTNPTISYGQYLDVNVTAGTSANATNAVITPVYVIP